MYGSSGKVGRGGGGGGGRGKRNIHSGFHPSPLNRPSSASGRQSTPGAGAANRSRSIPASSAPSTSASTEEAYGLVTSNPLNFAMTIKLAPNLVEEIKRVEAQGGVARIKFDGNINNPVGNIISIGGKEFRFTWSPETGDLCDIYEERRSGEDGNGLLVESGSAWRKLNVQRDLDESTQNQVKLRSEEAERKLKSRQAIVLDHRNPSTKTQIKAMAAAESNPWRNFKTKKEQPPAKRRKVEPISGGGLPKSVHKSVLTGTSPSMGRAPISSPCSPPEQLGTPASPFGSGNISKGHASTENTSTPDVNKIANHDKDTARKVINSSLQEKSGGKGVKSNQPSDLRSMLISLLMENPLKGMSLKALEKAAEDAIASSGKQIEPILKKIATFQAPGRYFLKPGVEIESLKKSSSEKESSPEDTLHLSPGNGKKYDPREASGLDLPTNTESGELDEQIEWRSKSEELGDCREGVDALHAELFGEKKASGNSEGPAVSSSDSGSDSASDTDSSGSGSDSASRSRSRSKSPAGSGSGSSSDSESDASTNSKEVSDEEVDIMSDDDEGKHKLQASGSLLPKPPVVSRDMDGKPGLIEITERQDGHNMIEIEKDLPTPEHVANDSLPKHGRTNYVEEIDPLSHYQHEQERQDYSWKVESERDIRNKDGFNHVLPERSDKVSRGKSKRALGEKKLDTKPERNKKLKVGNLSQQDISGSRNAASIASYQNSSDRAFEATHRSSNSTADRVTRDGNTGFDSQNGNGKAVSGKSLSDTQEVVRSANPGSRTISAASIERSSKHGENLGHNVKLPEMSLRTPESSSLQKARPNGETKEGRRLPSSKGLPKSSKEGFRNKHTPSVDSQERSVLSSQTANTRKDDEANMLNRTAGNGRPHLLQRELSDLELGELREPSPDVTPAYSKQTGRKSSSKQAEITGLGLDAWNNPNTNKGKPPGKVTADSVNPAPTNSSMPSSGMQEGIQKRMTPQYNAEDVPRPNQRASQSMQMHEPRVDHVDAVTQANRRMDMAGRDRGFAERSLDMAPEVNGKPLGRFPANAPEEHGGQEANVPLRKESRKPKPSTLPDLNDKQKDPSLTGSSDSSQRRRESSSDESSCPYSKYEKEDPQLKGSIKDFSEYKEYVKEYQEKYDIYVSLHKVLESSREEFLKHQREIEASVRKDPERYYQLVRQIKESFGHSAERQKRLKKIFIVLHEELANLKQKIQEFAAPHLKNQ